MSNTSFDYNKEINPKILEAYKNRDFNTLANSDLRQVVNNQGDTIIHVIAKKLDRNGFEHIKKINPRAFSYEVINAPNKNFQTPVHLALETINRKGIGDDFIEYMSGELGARLDIPDNKDQIIVKDTPKSPSNSKTKFDQLNREIIKGIQELTGSTQNSLKKLRDYNERVRGNPQSINGDLSWINQLKQRIKDTPVYKLRGGRFSQDDIFTDTENKDSFVDDSFLVDDETRNGIYNNRLGDSNNYTGGRADATDDVNITTPNLSEYGQNLTPSNVVDYAKSNFPSGVTSKINDAVRYAEQKIPSEVTSKINDAVSYAKQNIPSGVTSKINDVNQNWDKSRNLTLSGGVDYVNRNPNSNNEKQKLGSRELTPSDIVDNTKPNISNQVESGFNQVKDYGSRLLTNVKNYLSKSNDINRTPTLTGGKTSKIDDEILYDDDDDDLNNDNDDLNNDDLNNNDDDESYTMTRTIKKNRPIRKTKRRNTQNKDKSISKTKKKNSQNKDKSISKTKKRNSQNLVSDTTETNKFQRRQRDDKADEIYRSFKKKVIEILGVDEETARFYVAAIKIEVENSNPELRKWENDALKVKEMEKFFMDDKKLKEKLNKIDIDNIKKIIQQRRTESEKRREERRKQFQDQKKNGKSTMKLDTDTEPIDTTEDRKSSKKTTKSKKQSRVNHILEDETGYVRSEDIPFSSDSSA